jgi:nicotinamide riboside kinase
VARAHGRTPHVGEQAAIAAEQTRRIAAASVASEIVVADTTALMTAVYSELVFGDAGLYPAALKAHAAAAWTLVTALDLPWHADGVQRDGAHVREPVDALLRSALSRAGAGYAVISGHGPARCAAALASVERALAARPHEGAARWRWICARCGEVDCEHRPPPPG